MSSSNFRKVQYFTLPQEREELFQFFLLNLKWQQQEYCEEMTSTQHLIQMSKEKHSHQNVVWYSMEAKEKLC